jgi:LAO/AO transport system kinase
MNDIAIDENVFIRSMATRGSLGGLAATTKEILDLMDCFGFDRLLAETVGVGQTELEIARAVDTVVVVLVPESGDSIQAMKAGLMEIADIFIVNKADRPGSDKLVKEVRQAMHLRSGHNFKRFAGHHGPVIEVHDTAELNELDDELGWEPLVLKTNALTGEGIQELTQAIESHGEWIQESGELQKRRKQRTEVRIREVMHRELVSRSIASCTVNKILTKKVEAVLSGHATPYSVAMELVDQFLEKDQ